MKKIKRWFTLIEIIIVISIITILLWITMSFSTQRIQKLRYQSAKSQFLSTYEQLHSYVLTTNYWNQKRFDYATIVFSSGSNNIQSKYVPIKQTFVHKIEDEIILWKLKLNWEDTDKIIVKIEPYTIWCKFDSEQEKSAEWIISFILSTKFNNQKYCFDISSDNCILKPTSCEVDL